MRSCLSRSVFLALVLSSPLAAQDAVPEPALAVSHADPALQWGPCPDFLPAGCAIAVLHGDPAGNNADVFFKVPPDSHLALHRHTSAERMVLVAGALQVSYEGQATVRLTPGMYAYGPATRAHSGYCEAGEACVLFIAFESPVDAVPVQAVAAAREAGG
jgi:quercetin dioxygenase-like cupin family protein